MLETTLNNVNRGGGRGAGMIWCQPGVPHLTNSVSSGQGVDRGRYWPVVEDTVYEWEYRWETYLA